MAPPDPPAPPPESPAPGAGETEALRARVKELEHRLANLGQPVEGQVAPDRTREAELLARAARLFTESRVLEDVGRRIGELLLVFFGVQSSSLRLLAPDRSVVVIAWAGRSAQFFAAGHVTPPGQGMVGRAVTTRQSVQTPDLLADPSMELDDAIRDQVRASDDRAFLAIPLRVDEEIIGVLTLADAPGRVYTEAEVALAQAFADQAALALDNARLVEEARRRASRLQTLTRLNALVSSSLDMPAVLTEIARDAAELVSAPFAAFWLADEAARTLEIGAVFADETIRVPWTARSQSFSEGVVGWVATHRMLVNVPDAVSDARVIQREWLEANGLSSVLAVPVVLDGALLAVLALPARQPLLFGPESADLLESFAGQAAVAIGNARLYARSEERRRAAEALAHVTRALTETLDATLVARRVADSLRELFAAQAASVYRLEASGDLVTIAGTREGPITGGVTFVLPPGHGVSGLAVRERRPIVTADLLADSRITYTPESRAFLAGLPGRASLAVPLIAQGRVLGALSIRGIQPFDERAVSLAQAFADQAVIALENARLYQEARTAYEELERAQQQLVQAQKMEAVGRLAGGLAHDFNNLLTVITGRNQLVLDSLGSDDPRRAHLQLSVETAKRAGALTRQLLAFSRRQILQPKVLDLNRVVHDMSQMLRRLIGEDIDLQIRLARNLGRVKADPSQIEQVILNLVVNARDSMPHGGRLVIETDNAPLDDAHAREHDVALTGPAVRLRVRDTGVGMDTETRVRIFEPFFTTKLASRGTGLGLATVSGIVEQSDGYIAVSSEPGRGSTFDVYLPRVQEAETPVAATTTARAEAGPGTETILLVEDDPAVLEIARIMLETSGYAVLPCGFPGEALSVAAHRSGPIHLLLTDLVMPEMDGYALAERLRARRRDLKVLYMSGHTADAIVVRRILESGAVLLQKPFDQATLLRTVREALSAPPSG